MPADTAGLPPFRDAPYVQRRLRVTRRADSSVLLDNDNPLRGVARHAIEPLAFWAAAAPQRKAIAQRAADGSWEIWSYAAVFAAVRALGEAFADLGLGPEAPLMILSRNSVEHALATYGAMLAHAPVCPVTPAYSLLAKDHERLRAIVRLIQPRAVFVEDGALFQRALEGGGFGDLPVIYARNAPQGFRGIAFADLQATAPSRRVNQLYEMLTHDHVCKYLLTSGSTGAPKAVINTHRMLCANAAMIRSIIDPVAELALPEEQTVICNFLPWSHTFGANAILHLTFTSGGVFYVDWGAPTPDRFAETLRNLKEVSPTQHTTVPAGWAMIATELEKDPAFAANFFKDLRVMAYGGAAMGQDLYERIQAMAIAVTGHRITLSAGYGATETAPTVSNVHWLNDRMGLIGLPIPASTMKLVPNGDKYELRVKGPHITPGYLHDPERTAQAFDEEGFYKLGDAVRFADPHDPEQGLAFAGRIAEEFKLASGTWVSAGKVRVDVVTACGGVLADAVICGLNEPYIAILGFLNLPYCQRLVGAPLSNAELAAHPAVIAAVEAGLAAHNRDNPNQAARIARAALLTGQPRLDNGEITDKGYLNQARCRDEYDAAAAALFAVPAPDGVISVA